MGKLRLRMLRSLTDTIAPLSTTSLIRGQIRINNEAKVGPFSPSILMRTVEGRTAFVSAR